MENSSDLSRNLAFPSRMFYGRAIINRHHVMNSQKVAMPPKNVIPAKAGIQEIR
jgi:hypothetical protein